MASFCALEWRWESTASRGMSAAPQGPQQPGRILLNTESGRFWGSPKPPDCPFSRICRVLDIFGSQMRTGSSAPQAATAPSLELYPARDSLINAIWLRWRQRHSDQAVAEDVLQLARVVLQLDGGRSDSAFDLTTLALQLAPVWNAVCATTRMAEPQPTQRTKL